MSTQATPRTDQTQQTATDRSLSRDEVFHLLQNARRRSVLRYLSEQPDDAEFEMRDIATQVAAWENDKPIVQLSSKERQRVYISLYQCHLPALDEAGVIDYNQSRGWVEPTPVLEQLESYVMIDADGQPAEPEVTTTESASMRYYGGATVVSVVLLVATSLGLAPAVIASSLASVITGIFGVTILGMKSRTLAQK